MNSAQRKEFYKHLIDAQIPRFFGLLDRQPFSPSAGSFDRRYWLHRTTDFPSAAPQMGVETLAFLIRNSPKDEPRRAILIEWFRQSFEFTLAIQNSDGSFDEWYPGEHGWAGPTGYILNSLCRALELTGDILSEDTLKRFHACCRRAGNFISHYEETDVLANHQAMGLLALASIQNRLKTNEFREHLEILWQRFVGSFSAEGWSNEYDGPDPGYQTATLSFLARLHRLWPDPRIEALIPRQLEFISHFFYPDGGFAGLIGSRGTKNIFVYGLEYWASHFSLSERLAQAGARSLQTGHSPRPQDQEDHYLIYRLPEFFEACQTPSALQSADLLPYEKNSFEVYWSESGYWIKKGPSTYWIANLKRGGGYLQFDIRNQVCLAANSGLAVASKKRIFTSNWADRDRIIERGEFTSTSGRLTYLKQPLFTPWKMIAFRMVFLVLARSPALAKWLKARIRRQVMVGTKHSPLYHRRSFKVQDQALIITDEIENPRRLFMNQIWWEGEFVSRLVPQSRYFSNTDLQRGALAQPIGNRGPATNVTTLTWDL